MPFSTATACHAAPSKRSILRHGALLLLLALPFSASGAENKQAAGKKPDKCIAEICLETPVTQEDIVAKYGPGREYVPMVNFAGESTGWKEVVKPDDDVTQRCYYDPSQHLYIEFDFDKHQQRQVVYNSDLVTITVSTVTMCDKKFTPKQPFPPFKTEHGVGIGATEAEVQAAMGKPDDTINMKDHERVNLAHRTHEALMRDHESAEYGETALYYNPDPQHSLLEDLFFISDGKVKSIRLSNSE